MRNCFLHLLSVRVAVSRVLFRMALCLVMLWPSIGLYAQESTPLPVEDSSHDDWHTFKHGKTYTPDPYTWVYTKEFAQKFRMPDRWIDNNLKGALAIAFRMTTIGNATCGLGGREDNCWPPLECQLDVYYDNRIKLPWVHDEIVRDFLMRGIASHEFLYDVDKSKGMERYLPRDPNGPRGVMESLSVDFVIPPKMRLSGAGANIMYYDREYHEGIGVIGFTGLCPKSTGKAHLYFYDTDSAMQVARMKVKRADLKPMHVIEIPEPFVRNAHTAYERDNKPNVAVTQELMRQFASPGSPRPNLGK